MLLLLFVVVASSCWGLLSLALLFVPLLLILLLLTLRLLVLWFVGVFVVVAIAGALIRRPCQCVRSPPSP